MPPAPSARRPPACGPRAARRGAARPARAHPDAQPPDRDRASGGRGADESLRAGRERGGRAAQEPGRVSTREWSPRLEIRGGRDRHREENCGHLPAEHGPHLLRSPRRRSPGEAGDRPGALHASARRAGRRVARRLPVPLPGRRFRDHAGERPAPGVASAGAGGDLRDAHRRSSRAGSHLSHRTRAWLRLAGKATRDRGVRAHPRAWQGGPLHRVDGGVGGPA